MVGAGAVQAKFYSYKQGGGCTKYSHAEGGGESFGVVLTLEAEVLAILKGSLGGQNL